MCQYVISAIQYITVVFKLDIVYLKLCFSVTAMCVCACTLVKCTHQS